MTPEGRIKALVKQVLDKVSIATEGGLWHHWPVQNGMGKPCLDCHAVFNGRAFAIEVKAPGKKPTVRQHNTMNQLRAAGCPCLVIDSSDVQPILAMIMAWNYEDVGESHPHTVALRFIMVDYQ